MKQLTNYADYGSFIFNIPELKPIQTIKIDEELTLVLSNFNYYFDTTKLKYRFEKMKDNNYLYGYCLYKDICFQAGYLNIESLENTIKSFNIERAKKLLNEFYSEAKDFTILTEREIKDFIQTIKQQQEERFKQKRLERIEREKREEEEREVRKQQRIKEEIEDFINNKAISGEVLLAIIRELDYKIPIRTAGSLKALHSISLTKDNCIQYCISKGRKLTDNMSFIIRDIHKILKDQYKSVA